MTSLIAVPWQLLATSCEVLFVLENKLRIPQGCCSVPHLKCGVIMEEAVEKVLSQMKLDKLFKANKTLTVDELRNFFKVIVDEPLCFEADSFEKVFMVGCMTVKVELTRVGSRGDMLSLLNSKLCALQEMVINPVTREALRRRREAAQVFYGGQRTGELKRVRSSVLNSLREVSIPVAVLVREGMQRGCGRAVGRTGGAEAGLLGVCRTFMDGSGGFREERLEIAEAEKSRLEEGWTVRNLYDAERIAGMMKKSEMGEEEEGDGGDEGDEGDEEEEERWLRMDRDIGDDILFGCGGGSQASFTGGLGRLR